MSASVILRPCACRSTSCNGGSSRPQVRAMSEHQRHNLDPPVRGGTNRLTRRHDWHHGSLLFANAALAWSVRLSRHRPAGGRHVRTIACARSSAPAACASACSSSSCARRTGSPAARPVASSPVGSDTSLRRPGPLPPEGNPGCSSARVRRTSGRCFSMSTARATHAVASRRALWCAMSGRLSAAWCQAVVEVDGSAAAVFPEREGRR